MDHTDDLRQQQAARNGWQVQLTDYPTEPPGRLIESLFGHDPDREKREMQFRIRRLEGVVAGLLRRLPTEGAEAGA